MSNVNIRPLGNKILFQIFPEPAEAVSGGIIVPSRATRADHRRAVVRRLPSRYRGVLAEGSDVYLKPYCGMEMKVCGDTLVFAPEEDVLCTVDA